MKERGGIHTVKWKRKRKEWEGRISFRSDSGKKKGRSRGEEDPYNR
jgi:hypothetical protein